MRSKGRATNACPSRSKPRECGSCFPPGTTRLGPIAAGRSPKSCPCQAPVKPQHARDDAVSTQMRRLRSPRALRPSRLSAQHQTGRRQSPPSRSSQERPTGTLYHLSPPLLPRVLCPVSRVPCTQRRTRQMVQFRSLAMTFLFVPAHPHLSCRKGRRRP